MKRHWPRLAIGIILVLLFALSALRSSDVPLFRQLDAYLYDARLRLFMPKTLENEVVIVDIDEKSLAELGRWPWGRNVIAQLVKKLVDDYQVDVVGFDVVFAEPDRSSGLSILEDLGRRQLRGQTHYQDALHDLRKSLDYDRVLAEAIKGRPVVLGYYFSNAKEVTPDSALPPPVFSAEMFQGLAANFVSFSGYGANLKRLQEAAMTGGHFNPVPDPDGVLRSVPMLVEYRGDFYESLSLAVARVKLGMPDIFPNFGGEGGMIESLGLATPAGLVQIPVDDKGRALIPYRGFEGSFPYVPVVDVLHGKVDPAVLKHRIVLIGTTAPGLKDLRSTPVGTTYPGVEIHANLISAMLDGQDFKYAPGYVLAIDLLQILLIGLVLALCLPFLSPKRATLLALLLLVGTLGLNSYLWDTANLVVPLAAVLILIVTLYMVNMSWGYFVESRTKQQFTELFGQYVPPELVDEMARNPQDYSMEGRNESLTVLFSDVRDFTSISEGLDPKELTLLMNRYLGSMTRIIREHRGTLDKYIGDAIMAFWGAPVQDPAHARHALLAALAMQQEVAVLADEFAGRGWPRIRIGIGINTGIMTVGDMGSPVRKAYTVMGDAVNLASRLEGITKEYGVGILVGELTREAAPDILYRELDRVRVKGKDKPVAIYEPIGAVDACSDAQKRALALWEDCLARYRACDWDAAAQLLDTLRREGGDSKLYSLYSERIAHLRDNPPESPWDGVTTFKTK